MRRSATLDSVEHEKPKASLSCLQCQRRKRKCDKQSPCQACQQAALTCTPISRARLPRGRHPPARDDDLRQRVARLEKLLAQSNASAAPTPPDDDTSMRTPKRDLSCINEEVVGIRELLDDLVENEPNETTESFGQHPGQSFDLLLYGDASCFVQPSVLQHPPAATISQLIDIYLYRVDPVFKVTHVPSILRTLTAENTPTPAQAALKFSVFFTAANSLHEEECFQLLNSSKSDLCTRFRLAAEVSLSKCGLLTTTNLTVLQAYVIYLAGLRASEGSRAVCVLVGTAIRIGQFMGLHLENSKHTPFETQLRRRIWYSIGILDLQAAFDSGSYSAFVSGVLLGTPPLHINDSDISPDDKESPKERQTFSDMTFACATHEMLRQMRKMTHTPVDNDGRPLQDMQLGWTQRYAIVDDCSRVLNGKYLKYCDSNVAFQRFTTIVCNAMVVTLRLLVRRPMYRSYKLNPPPNDGFNVLDTATEVLEQALHKMENNEFRPWQWFGWIKWYAMAIVFAELCEHTEGPLVQRAWVVVEASFTKYKALIRDPTLWGSLEKLRRKVQSARVAKDSTTTQGDLHNTHTSATLGPGMLPTNVPSPERTFANTNSYENSHDHNPSWSQTDYLSWINWDSFVQDLGDPVQLDLDNGFY